jgi:drug/metabolite transporter (DMT)-like permease
MAFFFLGTTAPTRLAPNPALGDALALASGLTFAFTIAGMRWLGTRPGDNAASSAVVAGNVIAALFCAPLALPLDGIGVADAATILYLGIFQIGLAYAWMARALPHVPAFEASILLLAEPVFNPLWTWLTQGEKPGGWAILGGAMILGATLVKAWLDRAPSATEP